MRAFLTICLAGLVLCPSAGAVTLTPGSLSDSRTLHMVAVARAYWHADPSACSQGVRVTTGADARSFAVAGQGGDDMLAFFPCTIALDASVWFLDPAFRRGGDSRGFGWNEAYCVDLVHEWGHLVLGPTYFAGSNPTDPAHSPDPHSIMYYDPTYVPAGCKPRKARRAGRRRASRQVFYSDRLVTERPHPQLPVARRHGP